MKIGYRLTRKYKDKPSTIFAYFRYNNKVIQKSTGLTVRASSWSDKKQRSKGYQANLKHLNNTLDALSTSLMSAYNRAHSNGEQINAKWLDDEINAHFGIVEDTDFSYMTNVIEVYIEQAPYKQSSKGTMGLSKGVVNNWKTFLKITLEFEKDYGKRVKFSEVDNLFANRFRDWLMTNKRYNQNYTNKHVSRLKTMCKEAVGLGVDVNSAWQGIKSMQNTMKTPINVLSFGELSILKETEMPNDRLQNVKDWILLGAYSGQRSKDLLALTEENYEFKDNRVYISLTQTKGNKPVVIGIDDDYIVSMLKNHPPYKISRQKLSRYMEEVLEIAGFDEKVDAYLNNPKTKRKELVNTFKFLAIKPHDLRRSFCTNYFHKGISVNAIMQLSGHSREATFFSYIGLPPDRKALADAFLNANK